MKSLIKSLCIMTLCLFSLCIGQTSTSELTGVAMEVGTTKTFEFYEHDTYIGYCQYTVTKLDVYNDQPAYFIDSVVDLDSSSYSINIDATYVVDSRGVCLHYEFEATFNDESQTMNADLTESTVHITGKTPGKTYDETITLSPNTLSMDNNLIGQWDIAFSAVALEKGQVFAVNAFAAQPMKTVMVRASISDITVPIQTAGKTWECLVLEFSEPMGYTAYVTEEGQLVKMENESGFVITLIEVLESQD